MSRISLITKMFFTCQLLVLPTILTAFSTNETSDNKNPTVVEQLNAVSGSAQHHHHHSFSSSEQIIVQGPAGPMGPTGPTGKQGVTGPAGTSTLGAAGFFFSNSVGSVHVSSSESWDYEGEDADSVDYAYLLFKKPQTNADPKPPFDDQKPEREEGEHQNCKHGPSLAGLGVNGVDLANHHHHHTAVIELPSAGYYMLTLNANIHSFDEDKPTQFIFSVHDVSHGFQGRQLLDFHTAESLPEALLNVGGTVLIYINPEACSSSSSSSDSDCSSSLPTPKIAIRIAEYIVREVTVDEVKKFKRLPTDLAPENMDNFNYPLSLYIQKVADPML